MIQGTIAHEKLAEDLESFDKSFNRNRLVALILIGIGSALIIVTLVVTFLLNLLGL